MYLVGTDWYIGIYQSIISIGLYMRGDPCYGSSEVILWKDSYLPCIAMALTPCLPDIMTTSTPNFPLNLDIHPSTQPLVNDNKERIPADLDAIFGSKAQERAIREYGIAGRVW